MKSEANMRDFYEAWFLAYKAALQFQCLKERIGSQRELYASWGDVRRISFDRWWSKKERMFSAAEGKPIAGTFTIRLPIGQRVGSLLRDVRKVTNKKLFGKRKGALLRDSLLYYTGYYLPWAQQEAPRTGKSQVPHVEAYFHEIGRKPPIFLAGRRDAARRALNRCVHRAEAAIVAIAEGTFPDSPKNAKRLQQQMEDELFERRRKRDPIFAAFYVSFRTLARKGQLRKVMR